jgi:hypothetical protein
VSLLAFWFHQQCYLRPTDPAHLYQLDPNQACPRLIPSGQKLHHSIILYQHQTIRDGRRPRCFVRRLSPAVGRSRGSGRDIWVLRGHPTQAWGPCRARHPCCDVISGRDASAWRAETPARQGRVRLREEEDDRLDVGQCPRLSEAASGDAWDDEDHHAESMFAPTIGIVPRRQGGESGQQREVEANCLPFSFLVCIIIILFIECRGYYLVTLRVCIGKFGDFPDT